eukprot:TRINITY_DN81284_c0_g1_i1.p1 TRINITY_DN81284_c0_g1~~TRINITY_DN81284_c0_g1_i1.p1  ORF type:complete len:268 (+),score=60.83 TRINITY_DN81284_c0_g1_i1:124-927(+)
MGAAATKRHGRGLTGAEGYGCLMNIGTGCADGDATGACQYMMHNFETDDIQAGVTRAGTMKMVDVQGRLYQFETAEEVVLSVDQELLEAARAGNHIAVKVCLKKGASTEARLPLRLYAQSPGDREEAIATMTDNLWCPRHQGLTPLMYAAKNSHVKCLRALLTGGADVNAEDEDAVTPLHFAAAAGSFEACRMLIDFKADCMREDSNGVTVLDYVNEDDGPSSKKIKELLLSAQDLAPPGARPPSKMKQPFPSGKLTPLPVEVGPRI